MSSVIYFLSDAHLGAGPEPDERLKRERLAELFERIKADRAGLYILGDLFDFWFEYRTVVPAGHLETISLLRGLRDSGIRVTFIAGNHDYWAGRFFVDGLGIRVVKRRLELAIDGRRFLLAHGDGEGTGDWGYRFLLRPVLRCPVSIWLFSLLHPDAAIPFARWFSRASRTGLGRPAARDGGPLRAAAAELLGRGFDGVVLGHCHAPELTAIAGGTYLNLGEFFSRFTYGVYRDGSLRLENLSPPS